MPDLTPPPLQSATVAAIAVASGALVMAAEMLGSRWLAPYFGSSIYTWAALIACVLAALALGNLAGGHLADRIPRAWPSATLLIAAGIWLALLPPLAPPLLDWLAVTVPDERWGAVAAALLLLFMPLGLLGTFPPYAVRLLQPPTEASGRIAGRIYALSTVGGIAGTLGTPLVLIPWAGTRSITQGLAAGCVLCGAVLLAAGLRRKAFAPGIPAACAAMLALALGIAGPHPAHGAPEPLSLEQLRSRPDGLLAETESAYSQIFVHKQDPLLMLSFRRAQRRHVQSMRDLRHPERLAAPYTRMLTAAVLYPPEPKRLLMLGLGGGTTSTYLQHFLPDLTVQVVELDPAMVTLAMTWFGVRESDRYRIAVGDARVYLRRHTETFDIVVADAYRGDWIPFHLLTREYFAQVRARLAPGGVLAVNLVQSTPLYNDVMATLQAVFAQVDAYPVQGQMVAIAYDGLRRTQAELAERANALQGTHDFPHDLRTILDQRTMSAVPDHASVLTDDFAPVNARRGAIDLGMGG